MTRKTLIRPRASGIRETGAGKLTLLVFGSITAVMLFCAYHIGPFYYYYFELENQMASLIRVASTHTDQEIRHKLTYHLKKLEIPIEPDQVIIERRGDSMRIFLEYDEVFYVTWQGKDYDLHTFHFVADVQGNF